MTDLREEVSRAYAEAVCCPSDGCCGPKGVAAQTAGYSPEELARLPQDAVTNSFGCGNPLAFSDVQPGQTVLDLGSGAGIDLLIAAEKVGASGRVIGVDMTPEMLERARKNCAAFPQIDVRQGYIEELPVETASVDWVISNCVINLSPDKPKVFAEIARVLKPGGHMRVSDIVVQDLPEELRNDKALYSSCVAGAVSEEEYVSGLQAAGLKDVQVVDRVIYTGDQLVAFVRSELPGNLALHPQAEEIARGLEGRIWSARFTATRA